MIVVIIIGPQTALNVQGAMEKNGAMVTVNGKMVIALGNKNLDTPLSGTEKQAKEQRTKCKTEGDH